MAWRPEMKLQSPYPELTRQEITIKYDFAEYLLIIWSKVQDLVNDTPRCSNVGRIACQPF